MPLTMARPWKHPKTGIFWLRRAVPDDLRALVGKREEKRSLQTRDPSEARRLHALAMAEVEGRWKTLREGSRSLSEREANEMARDVHDAWLDRHRDEPSQQTDWPVAIGRKVFAPPAPLDMAKYGTPEFWSIDPDEFRVRNLEEWCRGYADYVLKGRGLIVDESSRLKLAKAIALAVQRASEMLVRLSQGEIDASSQSAMYPSRVVQSEALPASPKKPVTFDDLVKGWSAEKKPAQKTVYEWSRAVRAFTDFLGHTDAGRVTPDNIQAWKEALIAQGLTAKTIRDGKLVALRSIMQWGKANRRLSDNPAEHVSMDVKRKASDRGVRSFTEDEATIILKAALSEANPVLRWVPWLCAYSGARVSEVCQLRVEDVRKIEGIWCMKLDPEAGSLKTLGSERAVPLHQAVIDSGFLTYVDGVKLGPLFAKLSPDKFGKRGGNGTKMIGRWVRGLGLTDERLAPAHSWRHRMKTLGRRFKMSPDIVNAITGHGTRTVADAYGEYEVKTMYEELMKIPPAPVD
ncbi:integrase [Methylobacterium sp. WL64]|uniref:DUF6538 domain-containing protein n=1 Tax=Methylobacterium sp. WL64 TaxID=2603894 RepID=UPI0011CB7C32|nr:DUF6538 domain-containing protein [Methylobacterium sp. WL64]TXN00723.1 integrase [Methylobacterium sp. WL64]